MKGDTIAAIATGQQLSAIGIIRISGPDAVDAANRLFSPLNGKRLSESEDRKLIYGRLKDTSGRLLDMCLCTVSHAPDSYTGEDTAEFQCHGSPAVLRAVMEALFELGIRQAGPGEFTKRAFVNGKMDLVSAEAVADLVDAQTVDAAQNAAGQLSGAISGKMEGIYSKLSDMCSHFHAVLDYPDEDIEDFEIESYRQELESSAEALERLLSTVNSGRILKEGISTVIAGNPNAGKSSLLNALLGYDRAIVTPEAGTTRDTIEEKVKIGNLVLRLTDTAGLRETSNEAERLGVKRSLDALNNAELVINIIDGTTDDEPLGGNCLVVYNKCDLPGFKGGEINISAKTGEGIEKLKEKISERFPMPYNPAGEILTNLRQAEAVKTAHEYMLSAIEALKTGATPDIVLTEAEGAMNAIAQLTGRKIHEDITNRIFSRFCVGK